MATVERGNVVLTVKDDDIDRYLNMGYKVTDGKGNIIRDCIPTDIGTLRAAYISHKKEIDALKEEIAALKAQISGDDKTSADDNKEPADDGEDKNQSKRGRKPKEPNEEQKERRFCVKCT